MSKRVLAFCLSGAVASFVIALTLGQHLKSTAAEAGTALEVDGAGARPIVMAQAQSAPEATTTTITTTIRGGWTVTCKVGTDPDQKTCSAEFRVVTKESNNGVVLIWLLGRDAEGKLLSEFATPTDVLIKPGVTVSLNDASPATAEFISCTSRQGCRAAMELTPKLIRDLKAATKAKIGLTLLNGKVMEIGIEIPGADLAIADLGG